ncbi:CdaR family transcriptional regulator [Caproicibacter sp.]|uniref:CdaR family transcriptional regulator n=1 Tax=Caproicibacter sp. TaxID=2814884 RepID=UPI003989ADD5
MRISHQDAMRIVTEMSGIIDYPVNMMNDRGTIIASTDPKRIGQFHEGASQIVERNLDRMNVENDNEYAGAREGVNFPILFQNTIVGVVGITGKRAEVAKYGEIIKKMTEILLLDSYLKEQKLRDETIRNRFLEEWIFTENAEQDPSFPERGKFIGIDIEKARRVFILSPEGMTDCDETAEGRRLAEQMEKSVRGRLKREQGCLVLRSGDKLFCIAARRTDEQMKRLAAAVQREAEAEFGIRFFAGIDGSQAGFSSVYTACRQAEKALRAARSRRGPGLRLYDEVTVDIFLNEISDARKEEYIRRIFRGCGNEEIGEWARLLEVFFRANDSISKSAEELFMHKNTLQYRLKKLGEETGLDARTMPDAALFYLAVLFYRELHPEESTPPN